MGRPEKEVVEEMKRSFSLLHGVSDEISKAFRRYDSIREELGVRFMFDLDETFLRIREAPESYAPGYRQVRRVGLHQFPYVVSYVCDSRSIHIVAVRLTLPLSHPLTLLGLQERHRAAESRTESHPGGGAGKLRKTEIRRGLKIEDRGSKIVNPLSSIVDPPSSSDLCLLILQIPFDLHRGLPL